MDTLTETIDFPNVSTSLIAFYRPLRTEERRERNLPPRRAYGSNQSLPSNERVAQWKVQMYFPGPDARYNGALAELRPEPTYLNSIEKLTDGLEGALAKLNSIAEQQFQGIYRKQIGLIEGDLHRNLRLAITAAHGRAHLEIGALSSTSYTWHKELVADEVRRAIAELKTIPARAITLISMLEALA